MRTGHDRATGLARLRDGRDCFGELPWVIENEQGRVTDQRTGKSDAAQVFGFGDSSPSV